MCLEKSSKKHTHNSLPLLIEAKKFPQDYLPIPIKSMPDIAIGQPCDWILYSNDEHILDTFFNIIIPTVYLL